MISLYSHSSWKKVWIIVCRTCTTNTRETECFIAIDSCYTIFHNSKVCMWVKIGQKISFHLPCFCWLNHDLWYGVCFLAPKKPVCFSMAFFQRKWEKYLELLKLQIIGYKHGFWMVINTTLADSRWRKKLIKLINTSWYLISVVFQGFSSFVTLLFLAYLEEPDENLGIVFYTFCWEEGKEVSSSAAARLNKEYENLVVDWIWPPGTMIKEGKSLPLNARQ